MITLIVALMWWQGRLGPAGPSSGEAVAMCSQFAADRLNLPASAKHSRGDDARVSRDGDVFTVAGWSDTSERRHRWLCRVRPTGGDRWELLSIS